MLNVLIVGCGAIAGGYDASHAGRDAILTHAAAYLKDGRFHLAACVDPAEDQRRAFRQIWGVARDYPVVADALNSETSVDVVSICSPTGCHAADIDSVLALRPKAIFCEKPLAPCFAEAQRIVYACRAAGVALAVNHTRRWDPAVDKLREELRTGRHGVLRGVIGIYNKGVLNNGSHMIDLLHCLVGPLRLLAVGRPVFDHLPEDPTIPALLETEQGVGIHLAAAHAADYACFEVQFLTANGSITLEDGGLMWRNRKVIDSAKFPGYRILDGGSRTTGGYGQAMARAVANIYEFITVGVPLASDGDSALAAHATCNYIAQAGSNRRIPK